MRNYIVQGKTITVANAAVTAVHINPGASRVIKFVRAWCSQYLSTTSAMQGIELGLKATAFPTLTSVTPQKMNTSDPASLITGGTAGAAGTSGINASAEGAGAITTIYPDAFNVLTPWQLLASQMEDLYVSGADSLALYLKFIAAPATLTGWNFGIEFQEVG